MDVPALVATCPAMRRVLGVLERIAPSSLPVLLVGETGTGKHRLARALHLWSSRRDGPLVLVDAGRLAEADDEIARAAGGTLLVDELADTPPAARPRLHALLRARPPHPRIVATSARDEREAPASALLAVRLPPLRERGDDVVLLAEAFLGTFRQAERRSVPRRFSRRAVEALRAHAWPGNVRELESRVRRAVVVAVGPIVDAEDLALGPGAASLDLRSARARLERRLLEEALARSRGNITRAAAEMGVSRPTLHALMNKLGLRAAPFGV